MAKYGKKGWIKLWRAEMDNPLYDDGAFDKWHAWVDLLMRADSEGTVKTSLEALKNQWSWGSTKKVRHYLETVSETGLATVKFVPNKGTLIRINTGNSASAGKAQKTKKETVKETVLETEELLPKEVGRGSSLGITPPNNNKKNIWAQVNGEDDDEYE